MQGSCRVGTSWAGWETPPPSQAQRFRAPRAPSTHVPTSRTIDLDMYRRHWGSILWTHGATGEQRGAQRVRGSTATVCVLRDIRDL